MRHLACILFAPALLMLFANPAPVGAEEIVTKHSGAIVSIAGDTRTFVLAEVGPWQVRNGKTVMTYRTITLAPRTEYAMASRADDAPSGFAGDFVEVQLGPEDVYLNDYITVDCRREGKRLVALKITVAELPDTDR